MISIFILYFYFGKNTSKKYIYVNNTNGLFEIDNVTLELLKQMENLLMRHMRI